MATVLGLMAGIGVFSVWWSFWIQDEAPRRAGRWSNRTRDDLSAAGLSGVSPVGLLVAATGFGTVVGLVVLGLTKTAVIGWVIGLLAFRGPFAVIHSRARRQRAVMREVWPEVVDHLSSAIRAGLSLPEALGQIGERGPHRVRPPFSCFAQDYRASGRFDDSLLALKDRLADPVADRILESLRITREVGGSDLGRVLRSLSAFLREDARTRGEIEARQSWVVNGARIAVVAPWVVLLLLSLRPETASAYGTPAGLTVLAGGAASTVFAYRLMTKVGRLPVEERVLR